MSAFLPQLSHAYQFAPLQFAHITSCSAAGLRSHRFDFSTTALGPFLRQPNARILAVGSLDCFASGTLHGFHSVQGQELSMERA